MHFVRFGETNPRYSYLQRNPMIQPHTVLRSSSKIPSRQDLIRDSAPASACGAQSESEVTDYSHPIPTAEPITNCSRHQLCARLIVRDDTFTTSKDLFICGT
jgi:hypothetical protein